MGQDQEGKDISIQLLDSETILTPGKAKAELEYNSACWVVQHVQELPAGAWVANSNTENFW